MRRVLTALILIIGFSTVSVAQKGLGINRIFEGEIVPKDQITETYVKGTDLEEYDLTLFRSLKIMCTSVQSENIARIVSTDGKLNTFIKEEKIEGGMLSFAFYQFPAKNNINRYMLYQRNGNDIKLVYIEGKVSKEKLENMFKKSK